MNCRSETQFHSCHRWSLTGQRTDMSVGDGMSQETVTIFIGDAYVHELEELLGVPLKLSTFFLYY